ncbi:MAG: hypothetical protein HY698_19025 [Deltaproteobacteria bacterium]|nr:hypothetical protein [Deltaproteobacteria bacterium]
MKPFACIVLVLVACAGGNGVSETPPDGQGGPALDATSDAATDAAQHSAPDATSDAAPCAEVATCTHEISWSGTATTVELRGDFAPDAWKVGIPMTRDGDRWVARLDNRADGEAFEYKLLIDGTTWIVDPANPRGVPDGYVGTNSVAWVSCDDCPRATFDWRDAVIYFVLVDRFFDGDITNNDPMDGVLDPANFQGGDLAGVLAKLRDGYFAELGVNALWVSCPLKNADGVGVGDDGRDYTAYHGYWPTDLERIDPRIGDEELLAELVEVAHDAGIRVVLDYVMNHVHEESALWSAHPDWFHPAPGSGGCVCGEDCSWNTVPDRLRCWFGSYLPDFDFGVMAARNWSTRNAITWARRLGLDGYRLDAIKHVADSWITELRRRLAALVQVEGAPFYLVGETLSGDRELIRSYIDPATRLDGQFDFPWRAKVARALLRREGTLTELMQFLDDNDGFYGAGSVMAPFLGNHDLPRAIHLAEDPPLFDIWDTGKARAWTNQPSTPTDPEPYERLALAFTLLLTTPGAPTIYYGDELGLPGAGDPDNRRAMGWDGWTAEQQWLRDRVALLAQLRRTNEPLRRGRRVTRGSSTDAAVYAMVSGADRIWVALNRADEARPAPGLDDGTFRDLLTGDIVRTPLFLAPRSARVLVPK